MGRYVKITDPEILAALVQPLTMEDASDALMVSKRTLSLRVRKLVNKGLIKEKLDLRDARRRLYTAAATVGAPAEPLPTINDMFRSAA